MTKMAQENEPSLQTQAVSLLTLNTALESPALLLVTSARLSSLAEQLISIWLKHRNSFAYCKL